jgi:hypothetical protein
MCVMLAGHVQAQEYFTDSYQITNQHRFQEGAVGGFWGHHLGHMVRTATQGLWYVDDTGNDVNIDPALNYLRFDGTRWVLAKNFATPLTIQQNCTSVAVGDTIYSYGVNINGGYIEEAVYNTRTNAATWNRRIRFIGGGTNYLGAALSPNGTRVVWWTRVVNPEGPSDWVYMYNAADTGWSSSIVSKIAGSDFSYVFASFLNDSVFHVGGEVPHGNGPWTFEAAAGKVTLGSPLAEFTKMKGSNTGGNDIWVNRENGDVHFFTYGSYGAPGYFYKPAGGSWSDTVTVVSGGGASRARVIDSPDGNLYMILLQGGIQMMVIPKSSITGKIDFTGIPLVPLTNFDQFSNTWAIWPEVKEFQTTPVAGIHFGYPGSDYTYSNLLRHNSVTLNPGNIALRVQLPNGNETLTGKTTQTIYWYRQAAAGIDTVRIDYSTDAGVSWLPVAARAPNKGSFSWSVPPTASTSCLIRVANVNGGSPADTSDARFTIDYTGIIGKPPVAQITRPTKDTTVYTGKTVSFQGTGSDTDGYVVNYVWNTGDGRVVKGIVKTFDHIYTTAGVYYATLQVEDNDTLWSTPDSVKMTVLPSTGVEEDARVPRVLALHPNYPNPCNAGTVISYSLDRVMHVRVRIFSVVGEELMRLVDEVQAAGLHRIQWDARNKEGKELASGMYICRLETPEALKVQKILLLR